jgi:uncharacterized LabA/DUF88 family protein
MALSESGSVALLVDFENLVRGLMKSHGGGYETLVDAEPLFQLSAEYGQVVVASAYADWRMRDVHQFQEDLYRAGIDLIHVFGKRQGNVMKNAVDVKMALDACELIWTLPHVRTFVIVSGDRDFIHLLKTLRKHGKTVIGVSPSDSTSDDFAELCDRFARYESLVQSYNTPAQPTAPQGNPGLEQVRAALAAILAERPGGMKGAQLKPELRRRLSATFDESELGFRRFLDLLLAIPDVIRVELHPEGGDFTAYAARGTAPVVAPPAPAGPALAAVPAPAVAPAAPPITRVEGLKQAAKLHEYRYEPQAGRRRMMLDTLYRILARSPTFTRAEISSALTTELGLTGTTCNKTWTVLVQARCIEAASGEDEAGRQKMRLTPAITGAADLTAGYEGSIVYKLLTAARDAGVKVSAREMCEALGLPPDDTDEHAYVEHLVRVQTERMA